MIHRSSEDSFGPTAPQAILEFARDTGDVEAAGIVDAMTQMLEQPGSRRYAHGSRRAQRNPKKTKTLIYLA